MSEQFPSQAVGALSPEQLRNHVFPTARRGLDPDAVRRYLAEVADALEVVHRREAELRARLVEAEAERPEPAPLSLDPAALTAAVGQETARVLQVAHEAADELLLRARAEADEVRAAAGSVLEQERHRAEQVAEEITRKAADEAEQLSRSTREECREMVEVARAARQRILADLAVRRRELHVQLEQLRAGKDALADVVDAVASYVVHSVDDLKSQLAGAEERARLAADAVAAAPGAFVEELSEAALIAEAEGLSARAVGEPRDLAEPADVAESRDVVEPADVVVPSGPVAAAAEPSEVPEPAAAEPSDVAPDEIAGEVLPLVADGDATSDDSVAAVGEPSATSDPHAIDELFAKIRQGRAEEVERARSVLEDQGLALAAEDQGEKTGADARAGEAPAVAAPTAASAAGVEQAPTLDRDVEAGGEGLPADDAQESEDEGAPTDAGDDGGDVHRAGTPEAEDELPGANERAEEEEEAAASVLASPAEMEAFARREELLAESTAELARVLKRQLRMEQNQLLDAFRNLKRGGDPIDLLPGAEMAGRLEGDVRDALTAAFAAGRGYAAQAVGREPEMLRQPVDTLVGLSGALANSIVEPIHRRVEQGLITESEEPAVAIGAAFREWKGNGAEQAALEFAMRAFSAGVVEQAAATGSRVSWVVDDGEQRCPDCDDNAIAGAQTPGEAFPTGHVHPPIHPGCRCLLVVAPA